PSTPGFISNHWYGPWGKVIPGPPTGETPLVALHHGITPHPYYPLPRLHSNRPGRPHAAHCFARHSTSRWETGYATTRKDIWTPLPFCAIRTGKVNLTPLSARDPGSSAVNGSRPVLCEGAQRLINFFRRRRRY